MTPYPDFVAGVYRAEIDKYRRMGAAARAAGDPKARHCRRHYIYWRRRALRTLWAHGFTYGGAK
jgi:hypothetical protein